MSLQLYVLCDDKLSFFLKMETVPKLLETANIKVLKGP